MFSRSSCTSVNALTASGTVCTASSRLCAVTVISSRRLPVSAGAGAATAVPVPACNAMPAAPEARSFLMLLRDFLMDDMKLSLTLVNFQATPAPR